MFGAVSRASYFRKTGGRPNRDMQKIVMQTRQELKMYHLRLRKILVGKQIMATEKIQQKSHRVYPPEIIQTSSLGRLQKKSVGHNDCLYAMSVLKKRARKPPTDNAPIPQNYFQKNCRSAILMLLKSIGTTLDNFV